MDPTIIAGGLKLLGGLLGSKKKSMSPQQSIMSTAAGARQAAKKYGFNALTLLAGSNATAGAGMDMGTPPLASLSVLGDLVEDQFGDDAKTRREHNQLQNELLRLEVDRARSLSPVKAYYPDFGGSGYGSARANGGREAGEGNYLDDGDVSSFAADAVLDRRDTVTPVQAAVAQDLPAFRLFGHDFFGSGMLSTGQQIEDSIGEGPAQWVWGPMVLADAFGNEAGKWLARSEWSPVQRDEWKRKDNQPPKKRPDDFAPYGRDAYGRPLPKPVYN